MCGVVWCGVVGRGGEGCIVWRTIVCVEKWYSVGTEGGVGVEGGGVWRKAGVVCGRDECCIACERVCACACERVCACACVRVSACVRACVCVYEVEDECSVLHTIKLPLV